MSTISALLAQAAPSDPVLSPWITTLIGLGGFGLMLLLLLIGRLHTDPEFQTMKADRDTLKHANDLLLQELFETRSTMGQINTSQELTNKLLDEIKSKGS